MAINGGYRSLLVFLTVAATAAMSAAQGSGTTGTCATQLIGCASYLNATTTPPSSCCGPLKDAVTNQKACLCGLYQNPQILAGINITQALNLPVLCKIHTTASPQDFCKDLAPSGSPSSSSSSTPSSSSSTPSGGSSSGTGTEPKKNNSAARITGTVFVSVILMLVTYVVVY